MERLSYHLSRPSAELLLPLDVVLQYSQQPSRNGIPWGTFSCGSDVGA